MNPRDVNVQNISLERFICGLEQNRRPIIILVNGQADNGL